MHYKDIIKYMEDMEDDSDNEILLNLMNEYCSLWDIREGYKYAIAITLRDQYENHADDQEEGELEKIMDKLTKQ